MKFLVNAALLLATALVPFSAVASSCPRVVTFSRSNGQAKGAAYFMNNEPSGNYVFAADIGADAKVTLRKAYYTGGKGGHATSSPVNNALFSANSVYVFNKSKALLVVNAGSNTVSLFDINPKDPSELTLRGTPLDSGGDFPISIAVNNAGTMACVLNTGALSGVSCFEFDSVKGLAPIPNTIRVLNLPQTSTIPSGPDTTASDITFTDDGKKLVVSVKGAMGNPSQVPGFLAIWDVNKDRSLSIGFTPIIGGVWIWGLAQIPGKNAFIGGDGVTGVQIYNLDAPMVNQASRTFAIKGQGGICWVTYSNVTKNFYLVDLVNPTIDEVHVDDRLNATLVASHPLDMSDEPSDVSLAHISGKDRMYLLASGTTSVEVITVEGPGRLDRIQKLNIGALARRRNLAFDATNNFGIATYVV